MHQLAKSGRGTCGLRLAEQALHQAAPQPQRLPTRPGEALFPAHHHRIIGASTSIVPFLLYYFSIFQGTVFRVFHICFLARGTAAEAADTGWSNMPQDAASWPATSQSTRSAICADGCWRCVDFFSELPRLMVRSDAGRTPLHCGAERGTSQEGDIRRT